MESTCRRKQRIPIATQKRFALRRTTINPLTSHRRPCSAPQVSAQDQDSEQNAAVSYQIVADLYNSTDYFSVDNATGAVVTARMLDFELVQRYDFIVRATDGGDPALGSDVSVTVTVTDTNDNPPDFSQPLYEAYVSELAPRGHFVTCVQASDADVCDADKLRCEPFLTIQSWKALCAVGELNRAWD